MLIATCAENAENVHVVIIKNILERRELLCKSCFNNVLIVICRREIIYLAALFIIGQLI